MSDFHQFGPVTALPRLVARPIEDLEARVLALTRRFPVALVIPMLPSEMDRPALARILEELTKVSYVDTLLISLNRATAEDHARAQDYFASYEGRKVILWNEAPAVQVSWIRIMRRGSTSASRARGAPAGWPSATSWPRSDVLHRLPGRRRGELLAGDAGPAGAAGHGARPWTSTSSRPITRGSRIACMGASRGCCWRRCSPPSPASSAQDPYIRYLSSFRYALSGEFATKVRPRRADAPALRLGARDRHPVRGAAPSRSERVCQVELAERYDHKHQDLSGGDPTKGLQPHGARTSPSTCCVPSPRPA